MVRRFGDLARAVGIAAMWIGGVLCAPHAALGQAATARLAGVVLDESGASVPGAQVTVESPATGLQRQRATGREGQFVFPSLPPGSYRLNVELSGFVPLEVPEIILNVADDISISLKLTVASVGESVTVAARPARVNVSGAVGTTVEGSIVENAPLNGRTIQPLLTLSPGVLTVAGYPTPGQFVTNGQRPTANYITLDGASANAGVEALGRGIGPDGTGALPGFSATGTTANLLSPEDLAEFRVLTSTYAPEYGRQPGAQVLMVTKAGTNVLRGSAFAYYRDGRLDATDWFINRSGLDDPAFDFGDFGVNLGGPLVRNRVFFYGSYQGQRLTQPRSATQQTPSDATRRQTTANVPLLSAFPTANGPDLPNGWGTLAAAWTDTATVNSASARVDTHVRDAAVFVRYAHSGSEGAVRGGSSALTTTTRTRTGSDFVTAGVTSNGWLGSVLEARVNASFGDTDTTRRFSAFGGSGELPLATLLAPGIDPESTYVAYYLATGVSGGWFAEGPVGGGRQRQYNLVLNATRAVSSHILKLGVDYRLLQPEARQPALSLTFTGAGPTSVASGGPTRLSAVTAHSSDATFRNVSLFLQDTWQAASRLSVTYGLRWDYNPPPTGDTAIQPVLVRGYLTTGVPSLDTDGGALWQADKNGLAPRVGAAYTLAEDADAVLVVKGGAGIFYDLGTTLAGLPFGGGFPYQQRLTQAPALLPLQAPSFPSLDLNQPGSSSVFAFPDELKLPKTYQWNAGVEWGLGAHQALTATYVGAAGRELLHRESHDLTAQYGLPLVEVVTNNGYSRYDALQIQFRRRFDKGFGAHVSYAWASSKDTDSHGFRSEQPSNRYDVDLDYGPSDYDVRHSLTVATTYTTGAGVHPLLSGWSIDTFVTARSSLPTTPFYLQDLGYGVFAYRPDRVSGVELYRQDAGVPGGRRVDGAAFTIPTESRQGSASRNSVRGFPLFQVDLGVSRTVRLYGRLTARARLDMFNVLNRPHFGLPDMYLDSALFGESITSLANDLGRGGPTSGLNPLFQVGGPRSVQLSLRVDF